MMRFDVDRNVLAPDYLIQYLQTAFVRKHILQSAKDAVNQSSINQKDVNALPVVIPPLPLQRTFACRAAAVETLTSAHRKSLADLDALFASLQHRAFRGDL